MRVWGAFVTFGGGQLARAGAQVRSEGGQLVWSGGGRERESNRVLLYLKTFLNNYKGNLVTEKMKKLLLIL